MKAENKREGISRILSFLKGNRAAVIAVVVIFAAVLLLAAGGGGSGEVSESDALAAELEELLSSLSGVGSCRVMVTYRVTEGRYGTAAQKEVVSVAVVCRGADRVGVRRELTEMLSALFGIGANRIHIAKMK